jgi:hypothetical protein
MTKPSGSGSDNNNVVPIRVKQSDVDPAAFRIPAGDTHGHSSRVWCRCQPGQVQSIASIVESKLFPYRTKGDLIRHAIHRHLQWLDGLMDSGIKVKSVTGAVDAILDIMRDDEFSNDFQKVFDKLNERIMYHLNSGGVGEARRLLVTVKSKVRDMPDGYWRTRYLKELNNRFQHILDGAPTANIGTTVDDDNDQ